MAEQPKSTADILAAIRKQQGGGSAPSPVETAAPSPTAEPPAATPAPPASAGEAPQGTANILAAIRAQGATRGEAAPKAQPAEPQGAGKGSAGPAPTGTASILAAIRGGGAAAAAAPTGKAATAGPKPAAKTPPPVKPAGDRPSVQEMLQAVKAGVKLPAPGTPKPPPRLPGGKPDVVVVKGGARPAPAVSRRGFWGGLWALVSTPFALAWTLMTIIGGIFTLKTAQFMMPNMVLELPSRFKVGVPSDYPLGSVSEKYKASRGVWIVHTDAYDGRNLLYGLASVCTHLGCTPNWLEGEQKFKCPCHGSGFYISGINFEGPAPRPLERVGIRVSEDGQIEIDKSLKFQEELGQWADPKSFIELV
jgi:cytochrome b6-f complex iron-sulfur subunit